MNNRYLSIALSFVLLIFAGCNNRNAARKSSPPLEHLQGKWMIISGEVFGRSLSQDEIAGSFFQFSETRMVISDKGGRTEESRFSVDTDVSPYRILLTGENPFLGIFQLQDSELDLCLGRERAPTSFAEAESAEGKERFACWVLRKQR